MQGPRANDPAYGPEAALVERDREIAGIDRALAAAGEGDGALLLIEGHAGIGKSRLVDAAQNHAVAEGLRVVQGRGSALEQGHPFNLVMQMFEPVVSRAGPLDDELLSGAAALARPLFEVPPASAAGGEEQVFALLHGLHWLAANLAEERPLLIAADDAHWADRLSLRFVVYLAQRLADLPIVVIATARTGEPGAPEDLLRQIRTHRLAEVVQPAPLSAHGVERIVAARLDGAEPAFAAACHSVTEGNPFLLRELLADISGRGVAPTAANAGEVGRLAPDSVLDAALVRLARLPTGTGALARATAILGDDARLTIATELGDIPEASAAVVADALAAAEILRPGEPLRFAHPLLHSAIYSSIAPAERARQHRRAAGLLHRTGAPVETVASHLLVATATGDPWAVDCLRSAAARSAAHGAAESAVRFLARALDEPPPADVRPEVLLELGEAEAVTGSASGLERLDHALGLAGDAARRAEIYERLGWMKQQSGDMLGAARAFERGVAELERQPAGTLGDRLRIARLQNAYLGVALLHPSEAGEARRRVHRLLEKPSGDLTAEESGLLSVVATVQLFDGEPAAGVIELARRTWSDGALLDRQGPNSPTVWHVIGCLSWSDALGDAERAIDAALAAARRRGAVVTEALAYYGRSWPRYWRGDLHGAAADAQAAVNAWSGEFTMYLPVAAYWLALTHLEFGDVEAAAAAVDLPRPRERWGASNMYGALRSGHGLVHLARGDTPAAVDALEDAGRTILGAGVRNPAVIPWRSYLAMALLAAGDRSRAREVAGDEVALARDFGAARPLGMALRAAGVAAGGRRGVELLEESVATLRRSPAVLELTRALVALGGALRRQGRRVEARDQLREAFAIAGDLGARQLEAEADAELRAAGGRPRRRTETGTDALTPSELRVATMAADGMTNREIAQALFVTVKGVQWHLGNAYRKLGVGRGGLRAVLHEREDG